MKFALLLFFYFHGPYVVRVGLYSTGTECQKQGLASGAQPGIAGTINDAIAFRCIPVEG